MISLRAEASPRIVFTPRPGFKTKAKIVERTLLYGHRCPVCSNIIQAFFHTSQEVSLWPYEETTVLSQGEKNMGEILKIVPDTKYEKGESCYHSHFYPGSESMQRITLKNHLIRMSTLPDAIFDRDRLEEVGERTCPWTGVFSLREDITIKDMGMVLKMTPDEFEAYAIPKISELMPDPNVTYPIAADVPERLRIFRWTPAVGQAPPVFMITREGAKGALPLYLKRDLLNRFKKPQPVDNKGDAL